MKTAIFSTVVALVLALVGPVSPAASADLHADFGPSRNLWIDRDALRSVPTGTSAWEHLSEDARGSWGSADISDQESDHDVLTFAGALYAVRTNDLGMRSRVVAAIEQAIGTEAGGRVLALGRNLTGYVLAADLVGYDSSRFRQWLDDVRTRELDGRTLISVHEERPNNWGTHAGAARVAVDLFIDDTADFARAVKVFQGFLGDRSAWSGFDYGGDTWQADPSAPVPINPEGSVLNGVNVDGALVDDIRRCECSVSSSLPRENYQWEAMQGIFTQATLLSNAGYDGVWTWSDEALRRATEFLYDVADFPADNDDRFVPFLIDAGLGTNYSAGLESRNGKSIGYTDVTHPTGAAATTRSRRIPPPNSARIPDPSPVSRFVPQAPQRLFDTRSSGGRLVAGETLDVQVRGKAGVDDSDAVTAVVLNVTATNTADPGFVTVWPAGYRLPDTSALNVAGPGETVANLVTVPLGDDGRISFYTWNALDLVVDVSGYFVADDSSSEGRFVPVDPARAFDTRRDGPVGAGTALSVQLADRAGVRASEAAAVVFNLTAISLTGPGFVTAYPHGDDRPLASNLNVNHVGDVRSNLVMVPLGDDGSIDLYSYGAAHLIGDVVGYITHDGAGSDDAGLFVATESRRHVDTRVAQPDSSATWLPGGSTQRHRLARENVPSSGAGAVLSNIIATEAEGPGHVTAWPGGGGRPETSTINPPYRGATRSGAAIIGLGDDDSAEFYTYAGTHLVIDVFGYFLD